MGKILTVLLLLAIAQASAQSASPQEEDQGEVFTLPVRQINEIPASPSEEDDILFIIPALYFEKEIVTIDIMPQAGAYRIHFPEPKSAR